LALPPLTSASPGWDTSQALRNALHRGFADESETEIYLTKRTSNIWSVLWKIGRAGETKGRVQPTIGLKLSRQVHRETLVETKIDSTYCYRGITSGYIQAKTRFLQSGF
jgi:hypothetical protein